MTNALLKLLTAAGTAAFLLATPVAAQNGGGGGGADVYPAQDMDERVSPYKHEMRAAFEGIEVPPPYADATYDATIGSTVPDTVTTAPVPQAIIDVSPDVMGYEYFTLPDGRIALVHPEDRTIATFIE